jgi:hypothetical protein
MGETCVTAASQPCAVLYPLEEYDRINLNQQIEEDRVLNPPVIGST